MSRQAARQDIGCVTRQKEKSGANAIRSLLLTQIYLLVGVLQAFPSNTISKFKNNKLSYFNQITTISV